MILVDINWHTGSQDTDLSCHMSWVSFFVSQSATLQTNRPTNGRKNGRHARSISMSRWKCGVLHFGAIEWLAFRAISASAELLVYLRRGVSRNIATVCQEGKCLGVQSDVRHTTPGCSVLDDLPVVDDVHVGSHVFKWLSRSFYSLRYYHEAES